MVAYEVEHLLIPEPSAGHPVNLKCVGLELNDVPAILQGGNIEIELLPVIGHDRHLAGGVKRPWDLELLQLLGRRVPSDRLGWIGLTQRLQQANGATISVQLVDVVNHDQLVAVLIQATIHAKGGSMPFDHTGATTDGGLEALALPEARSADQNHEIESILGETQDELVKRFKGSQAHWRTA